MPTPRRQYRPGSRNPKFRNGRISGNRIAWLRTAIGQFVMMRYEDSKQAVEEDEDVAEDIEIGTTYMLILPRPGGKPFKYNLTALTFEELDLTRQFFNLLFDLAEPIVKHRDKVAADAAEQGDDGFARYYRQVPQFVVREGSFREDDQRILDGSKDLSSGTGGDLGSDGGLRGSGDELAPGEPGEDRTQDDGSETDES